MQVNCRWWLILVSRQLGQIIIWPAILYGIGIQWSTHFIAENFLSLKNFSNRHEFISQFDFSSLLMRIYFLNERKPGNGHVAQFSENKVRLIQMPIWTMNRIGLASTTKDKAWWDNSVPERDCHWVPVIGTGTTTATLSRRFPLTLWLVPPSNRV